MDEEPRQLIDPSPMYRVTVTVEALDGSHTRIFQADRVQELQLDTRMEPDGLLDDLARPPWRLPPPPSHCEATFRMIVVRDDNGIFYHDQRRSQ